jgi:AsmA protein
MRPIRILLLTIAALATTLAVLALGLYAIARLSWSEARAAGWLTAGLGLPVEIGQLTLGYFPQPWVEVEQLSVAASAAAATDKLLEVERVRIVVPWRTALGRGDRIARAEVDSPRAHLQVDAVGQTNWDELVERLSALGGDEPLTGSLGMLEMEGGSIGYRNQQDDSVVEVTGLTISGRNILPGEFFPVEFRAAIQSAGYVLHAAFEGAAMLDPDRDRYAGQDLAISGWLGGGELGLGGVELAADLDSIRADLAAYTLGVRGLKFDGLGVKAVAELDLAALDTSPVAHFKLATEPFAPRTLGHALKRPLPETTDPAALARAVISLRGEGSAGRLQLDDIRGELDDSRFSGTLLLPAAGLPPVIRLDVDQVDLDRYLPPASAETKSQASPQAALQSLAAELQSRTVDAEITIGVARAAGVTARELKLTLVPDAPAAAKAQP